MYDYGKYGNGYKEKDEAKMNNINLDLYQHPSKRLNPKMRYRPAFDVYS